MRKACALNAPIPISLSAPTAQTMARGQHALCASQVGLRFADACGPCYPHRRMRFYNLRPIPFHYSSCLCSAGLPPVDGSCVLKLTWTTDAGGPFAYLEDNTRVQLTVPADSKCGGTGPGTRSDLATGWLTVGPCVQLQACHECSLEGQSLRLAQNCLCRHAGRGQACMLHSSTTCKLSIVWYKIMSGHGAGAQRDDDHIRLHHRERRLAGGQ